MVGIIFENFHNRLDQFEETRFEVNELSENFVNWHGLACFGFLNVLFLCVRRFSFFEEVTEHLSQEQWAHYLNHLGRYLSGLHLVLEVVKDVMNCVEVNVELETSRQIVLHLFEDHRKESGSYFIYHFYECFSRFITRIKILCPKTFDHDQVDQLVQIQSELFNWQSPNNFGDTDSHKRSNDGVFALCLDYVALQEWKHFFLQFCLDVFHFVA